MRQSGVLAAAGLHALEHHLTRLSDDHANARLIADAVGADAETNIVVWHVDDAPAVVERARGEGVLVMAFGPRTVRAVTHLDVSREDCARAAEVLAG